MTTETSTSFISEKVSPAGSAINPEQHALPRSIVLHLLPGILTGAAFFLLAPIAQRNGLPSVFVKRKSARTGTPDPQRRIIGAHSNRGEDGRCVGSL